MERLSFAYNGNKEQLILQDSEEMTQLAITGSNGKGTKIGITGDWRKKILID